VSEVNGTGRDRPVDARAVGKRRRRVLLVVMIVATLGAIAWGVTQSPFLDVDHLTVKGNEHTTADEVLTAAGVRTGDPMVWVDPGQAATKIEALPWVRAATVRREWPSTVRISVRERQAVAWVDAGGGSAVLIDPTGRVLSIEPSPPVGLPQLLDVTGPATVGAILTPVEGARVAAALGGIAASTIRTIGIAGGRVTLRTVGDQEIRMGRAHQIAEKLRAAFAVLGAPEAAGKAYVDVSAPSNPVAG
jgi:cell division protein FtsQ